MNRHLLYIELLKGNIENMKQLATTQGYQSDFGKGLMQGTIQQLELDLQAFERMFGNEIEQESEYK
jgi:hypothetical protein